MSRRRFSIFCGTNNFKEVIIAWKSLVSLILGKSHKTHRHEFEKSFSKIVGHSAAWSFSTARMGLYVAIKSLNLEKDAEVIIPAFTCVVVPNAINYAGLKPVYVDISLKDFNLAVDQVMSKVNSRTKVLYIQHTFGEPADCEELRKKMHSLNIYVIEDCAHGFGYNDESNSLLGSKADLAIYSLDHSKMINAGFGGVLASTNNDLIKKIEQHYKNVPELSWSIKLKMLLLFIVEQVLYEPKIFPYMKFPRAILSRLRLLQIFSDELITKFSNLKNYPTKWSEYMAPVGLSQLQKIIQNQNHRVEIVNFFNEKLHQKTNHDAKVVYPLLRYSVLVRDRQELENLFREDFELGIWFTTVFQGRQSGFEEVGYAVGSCPNAEFVAKHIFNFPTHERIPIAFLQSPHFLRKLEVLKGCILKEGF